MGANKSATYKILQARKKNNNKQPLSEEWTFIIIFVNILTYIVTNIAL